MTRPDLGSGRDVALNTNTRFSTSDRSGVILREEDEDRLAQYENEEGLLGASGTAYNEEDEEADRIFAYIDAKMSERRRTKTKPKDVAEAAPSIQTMFADAKRDLQQVSLEEWAGLPESGDFRAKRTKKTNEKERYTPIPDSVLLGGARPSTSGTAFEDEPDLSQIQEAKEQVLRVRLDQEASLGGVTSVDPQGYLASMQASSRQTTEVGDVKRARLMLGSAVQTNPHSPQAWIAAIRLEEAAMELKKAKEMARKACEMCPDSEDVWLEAIRLLPPSESLGIMSKALEQVPASGKLWLRASDLEPDSKAKKRILQRGIERAPRSEVLWKALIELEPEEADALALLGKAVECCPKSVDLWLALARLQDHEGARRTINRARVACPKNKDIWLAAARLEEAYENHGLIGKIIAKAVADLVLPAVDWISLAVECQESGDIHTAEAIITTIAKDLDLVVEAEKTESRLVAKLLYRTALRQDPTNESFWIKVISADPSDQSIYEEALTACPCSEQLWLTWVRQKAAHSDFVGAEALLTQAHSHLPTSEALWLAAVKMHLGAGNLPEARRLLALARERLAMPSEKVWRKSAQLEVEAGSMDAAKQILVHGLEQFQTSPKMWILLARLESDNSPVARGVFEQGLSKCPNFAPLWIAAATFEESLMASQSVTRARALLEKGRMKNPKSDLIWLESVRLEARAGQTVMAKALLSKALQACPKSGALWSEAVWMEPRPLRKSKATAALAHLPEDPTLFLTIAKLFWSDRKLEQARDYFERALKLDPLNGDVWAFYIRFAKQHLPSDDVDKLWGLAFNEGPPRNGQLWRHLRKAQSRSFYHDPRSLFASFLDSLPSSF